MAAGSGRNVAIYLGDGAGPPEGFTKLTAFRTNELTINGELVDISDKTDGNRLLLSGGGIKSYSMSGSGVFKDSADEETLRAQADAQSLDNYEFRFSDGSKYMGAFQVVNYSRSGDHTDAELFSATFESSGAVTFTA